ncbi:MAG: sigma factor, partial [Acidobacteriaceae bacterium]
MPPPVLVRSTPAETANTSAEEAGVPFVDLDPAARERVLLEHMPIVRYIARRIHERLPQHLEMEDLIGAGMVGLMDAFNKFDAGKNIQFRTYA